MPEETKCPQCGSELEKCLIQQNYSIIMCANTECSFPFNEDQVSKSIAYTDDKEILKAAKDRLESEQKKSQ